MVIFKNWQISGKISYKGEMVMIEKEKLLEKAYVQKNIPDRQANAYKNQFGHVLIIGGNAEMGGASQMAGLAAVNSGAGLTTIATNSVNIPAIHTVLPEAMVVNFHQPDRLELAINKANTILIGPGLGLENVNVWQNFLNYLIKVEETKTVVIDGDGLNLLTGELNKEPDFFETLTKYCHHQFVLTPHLGEWKRISNGQIDPSDHDSIQGWVDKLQVHLVLKGAPSRIFVPNKIDHWVNSHGNPGMSIGGTGDTLAGMIAGMVGQVATVEAAVCLAVFLHSYIADEIYERNYVVLPSQISQSIPLTMKKLQNSGRREDDRE